MRKKIMIACSLTALVSMLLCGCVGKLAGKLRESLQEELSSAADEIESGLSSAVSEAESGISEALSTEDSSKESETEEESASETSSEEETEAPKEEKKPVLMHLLKEKYGFYKSVYENERYRMVCSMGMDVPEMRQDEQLLWSDFHEALTDQKLKRLEDFEKLQKDLLDASEKATDGSSSSYQSDMTVLRSDNSILSYVIHNDYLYAGAARPWTYTETVNLDVESTKVLKLSDLVTDIPSLMELLRKEMKAYISEIPEIPAEEVDYFFEGVEPSEMIFSVGYDRIRFFFDAGDVFPAAVPEFSLDILFRGNESLFTEKVLNVPENYVLFLEPGKPVRLSDGRELLLQAEWRDEYYIKALHVSLDGKTVSQETSSLGVGSCLLMCLGDGRSYVYISADYENGYGETFVFDVQNEEPVFVGSVPEGMRNFLQSDDDFDQEKGRSETALYEINLDPMRFDMSSPTHLLSSYSISRYYKVGEDGLPVPLSEWYEMQPNHTLTMLQDLTVDTLDQETSEKTGEMTLHQGDKIILYRSDGKARVQAFAEDGTVVLLEVERDEKNWKTLINGIDIEELFDGMMFAG